METLKNHAQPGGTYPSSPYICEWFLRGSASIWVDETGLKDQLSEFFSKSLLQISVIVGWFNWIS